MKATKKFAIAAMIATAVVLIVSLGMTAGFANAANGDTTAANGGRYYTAYDSQEAVVEAGEEFNVELASEGMVLLKNDGTLPVSSSSRVSVLGIAQDVMPETSGSITESLRDAGFNVNPTLEALYLNDNAKISDFGNETALNNTQKQSIKVYNDVGIVVIARGTAGESSDRELAVDEYEDEAYLGNDAGWEHEAHETDASGNAYKHELQLTDSEQELIALAEQYCKKVVVLYSASYTFEMANLQNDDQINAIAWIGRLGDGGIEAVGQMLTGEINPSGKVVDEWTRDFTNDPTYANAMATNYTTESGSNSGYIGLDYEEDIYLGYKYYETYWAEAAAGNASAKISGSSVSADEWYDYNVVYPMGYGLSYTDFSFELEKLYTDTGVTIADGGSLKSADISSSVGSEASVKTLYADVAVTNIGEVAGKEVVQVYINAPYTKGGTEKGYYSLAGYTKTPEIKAGKTQTVTVSFNVQDFASFDYTDANNDGHIGYELDAGTYTVAIMNSSAHTNVGTDAYAETTFKIASTTYLDLDDYSGNEVQAVFSDPDSDYYSMSLGAETGMVLLSRADFDGTFPTAPTAEQYTLSAATIEEIGKYDYIDADSYDDTGKPWYVDEVPSNWTQGAGVADANGQYAILLDDMAGVPLYDENGNITAQWDEFMNQLTWDEIASLVNNGYHQTSPISTIGKVQTLDDNGPNYTYNLTTWVGTPTVSATWNEELCETYGMMVGNTALWQGMTGWYGPGANTHRSQFSGRSPEYFSQDGIQGGIVCAAVCRGATQTGINVYVKHFAMYDICSMYSSGCAQVSEQAMRENYLKIFQMCFQEGECHATMTAFNRIGTVYAGQNYALIQQLARDEWGWTGFCVTDIYMQIGNMSVDGLVRAGAEFPDGDFSSNATLGLSGTWDASYNNGQGGVLLDTGYSATQWYCARMSAMRILYNEANSAGNNNGIASSSVSTTISLTQGDSINQFLLDDSFTDPANGYSVDAFEITSGALPEGISIDGGYLTGVATGTGTYTTGITVYVDGWIGIKVNLTFDIAPIITLEEDISALDVGENVDVYVFINTSDIQYKSSYTVTISDGALPDGLTISENGRITGTTTAAGTYTFTIAINAVDDTTMVVDVPQDTMDLVQGTFGYTEEEVKNAFMPGGWMNSMAAAYGVTMYSANETYYLTYTIAVSGDASGDAGTEGKTIASMEINSNGELVVTYTDGTTQNLGKVVGADGADGKDGVDGEDGSGCGSVVATDMIWAAAIVIVALAAVLIVRKARKDRADK